jgi:hypothetical protein
MAVTLAAGTGAVGSTVGELSAVGRDNETDTVEVDLEEVELSPQAAIPRRLASMVKLPAQSLSVFI